MQLRVTSRTLASAVAAIGGLALLAGCAPSTISQDDFISAAADAGFQCNATEPADDRVATLTTCVNSDAQESQFVVFNSPDDVEGGDLMFYQDGDEIAYGDDWIIVGENKADVDQLAELVSAP